MITHKNWNTFMGLVLHATRSNITEFPFASFLGSDLLLEDHSRHGALGQTKAYDLLTELVDQLRKLEAKAGAEFWNLAKFGANRGKGELVTAPVHLVAAHLQFLFRWADVGNLAKALALALDGKQYDLGARMPLTPFLDDEAKIAEEQVSLEQVRQFVGLED